MKIDLYPTPAQALLAICGLLLAIWAALVLYAASKRRGEKRYEVALGEGTRLFVASFIVIALMMLAIMGTQWISDRFQLDRLATNWIRYLLAFALIFPAWWAWSTLQARRRSKHYGGNGQR